jgi:hypothetical protein
LGSKRLAAISGSIRRDPATAAGTELSETAGNPPAVPLRVTTRRHVEFVVEVVASVPGVYAWFGTLAMSKAR